MAGLGYKTFTAGEVLTAANVQGYLQDQSVMSFANAAARGSAIASPWQGATTFQQDTGVTETYYAAAGTANPGGRSVAGWYQAPIGRVLQVVNGISTARVTNNTATWVSTNTSATITPTSATSKIMVMVTHPISMYGTAGGTGMGMRIKRNSTVVWNTPSNTSPYVLYYTTGSSSFTYSIDYMDSPALNTAITYSTEFASQGSTFAMNSNANDQFIVGSITLFEVAA